MGHGQKMTNYGPDKNLDFNTKSEKPISKLSENHKNNVIGPTEQKLWPLKMLHTYLYQILCCHSEGRGRVVGAGAHLGEM